MTPWKQRLAISQHAKIRFVLEGMMSNIRKDFAIIINAFNEEARVEGVIESALLLTDNILLLDNCSSDSTVQIAKSYKQVHVEKHNFDETDYRNRIKFGLDVIKSNFPETKIVGHLNCSEIIQRDLVEHLRTVNYLDYTAIGVYRTPYTDGQKTHPYHLLYIIRSILKSHRTYRFMAIDQWDIEKCEIHAEWQPKVKRVYNVPLAVKSIRVNRDGAITINEMKHMKYSVTESETTAKGHKITVIAKLFLKPLIYFISQIPYLFFSYSDQRLISTIQHCYYLASVQLRTLKKMSDDQ
jgi:glycosyltransferase involved in cell wall biosynthesis